MNRKAEKCDEAGEHRLKLVVRKLPPNLSEDEFIRMMNTIFSDDNRKTSYQQSEQESVPQFSVKSIVDEPKVHLNFLGNDVVWFSFRRGKLR